MRIAISAESTIDLPKEMLEKFNIKTVPFTVVMGEEEYFDGEFELQQVFDFVSKTKKLPHTSAVNKVQYEEHFNKLLQEYDAIIHFSMSSKSSSAVFNAQSVASEMKNVYVVDTLSLSGGIALLAMKARKLVDQGKSVEEILAEINELIPKITVAVVVDKLNYLHAGGRCSGLTLFGANLLGIKPQLLVKNGQITAAKKFIGKIEGVVKKHCEDVFNTFADYDKENAFIAHAAASEQMIENAKQCLIARGFKNIYVMSVGSTIACHTGPKALGIMFINK